MPKARTFGVDNDLEWINLHMDEEKDLSLHLSNYGIDTEMLEYALDRNERARVEYDEETETCLIIFNVANREKVYSYYDTLPMAFFVQKGRLITMTRHANNYIAEEMNQILDKSPFDTIFDFLFSSLYVALSIYFPLVEEMDQERDSLNQKLQFKTTKENLIRLSNLETGMAYFRTASKQNVLLLQRVELNRIGQNLSQEESEQLTDALIEAKQLVEMTELSSQILDQLSSTYNNILNNNLNETMRILTILSILLTVPTIVTGFFGMNMPLPLEDNVRGWIITIIISAIGWFGLAYILKRLFK